MLKNISENLKKGGFFIGTTPDSRDIMSRLEMQRMLFELKQSESAYDRKQSVSWTMALVAIK